MLSHSLAPLGHRNFALYWAGHAGSNTGRWIELTGAVWLVFELTHSPVTLAFLGLARAIPVIILSPIAGVLVDRVDQRKLVGLTQMLGLAASLLLGVLVLAGKVELWHIYIQVAAQSGITAFDAAARQALFPRLVARKLLPEAVTLSTIADRLSQLIGPAVGGFAIAGLGQGAPFVLNAVTFLALIAAVHLIRDISPRTTLAGSSSGSSFRGELTDGLRHILAAPVLSGLLRMEIMFGILQMNAVMITLFAREILDVGSEGLGGLLAAPALGSVIGMAFLLLLGHTHRQGRFIFVCAFAYAGALIVLAVSREYALSFAALALSGLWDGLMTVTRHSVLQLAAPSSMRGRVMANVRTVTGSAGPLAQTQSGLMAAAIGPPLAVVAAATALAVAAALTARLNPALWRFSRDEANRLSVD